MAYVPTSAQIDVGRYLLVEPVDVAAITDTEALERAIRGAIDRGNPRVPRPTDPRFPKPVVLKYAKVRSWSKFAKTASCWMIVEKDKSFQIIPGKKWPNNIGWEDDTARAESFPSGTSVDEVVRRIVVLVQSNAFSSPLPESPHT